VIIVTVGNRTNLRRRVGKALGPCACQKLDPTILMMKSAKDRLSNELAEPVDRPMGRRILAQGSGSLRNI
jgi:hypothetical protein